MFTPTQRNSDRKGNAWKYPRTISLEMPVAEQVTPEHHLVLSEIDRERIHVLITEDE